MDYLWIIYLVVSILAVYLLIKLFKKAFKIAIVVLLAMVALSVIFGYPIFDDFLSIKDNLAESNKLFLLDDKGDIVAGFDGELSDDNQPEAINDLGNMNSAYENDFKSLEEQYYKTFVVNISIFDNNDENKKIEIGQLELENKKVIEMIRSDNALTEFSKLLLIDGENKITEKNIEQVKKSLAENNNLSTSNDIKAMLFMMLFSQKQLEDNFFLFRELRKGNIKVYPKTAFFKALDLIPEFIIEQVPTQWGSLTGLQNESKKKMTTSSP